MDGLIPLLENHCIVIRCAIDRSTIHDDSTDHAPEIHPDRFLDQARLIGDSGRI